ncbi:uncharacterized protein F5891DRAFT_1167021 [Suillus fuscotomentosus]|uniref:Uncharacterized protein n=1 Tax=Suillus fuscotomentosus TaxID=1912939 RepID=A0AAD4DPC1_9AGAM|nr:uncharacterized protein F5891DRAFT_1167021 [Suillus fuscotomentosus]KAG1887518.1 hypothetical protein F5891DRAFT_1167021 [Suillus fuscotomentosus]
MSSSCRYDLIVCIVAIHFHRAYCWQSHQNSRAFDFSVPSGLNRTGHQRPAQHDERGNLIYLALITERIPIIPKFLSNHIDPSAPLFVFGEVFDIPRLVKDPESQVLNDVDVWWTRIPSWVELTSPSVHQNNASFSYLASLGFPESRSKSLELSLTNRPSLQQQVSLPPDDHVLCFDFLYYISAHHTWEWEIDYSPAWRSVGQHMRWTASMEKIADADARRAMNEPTPPQCEEFPVDQCFVPLSVIARRVSEVQEELRTRKGIDDTHVIMTSDERDPHPVFIDVIIRSNEAGFVGTRGSTLASRRVQSRHDGATRLIRWE